MVAYLCICSTSATDDLTDIRQTQFLIVSYSTSIT